MPTGYTHAVQTGKITEFSDFALTCARNFGALIMMRDEPWDAPIPQRFEPSGYHSKKIAEAEAELSRLSGQSASFWEAEADLSYRQARGTWKERRRAGREVRARYEAMLAKVEAWAPPTPDHEGLKSFMVQQLTESIRFDCGKTDLEEEQFDRKPTRKPWEEFRAERLALIAKGIAYHTEEHRKEVERTEGRNKWLADLRASL